jgi:hypothetical protein
MPKSFSKNHFTPKQTEHKWKESNGEDPNSLILTLDWTLTWAKLKEAGVGGGRF